MFKYVLLIILFYLILRFITRFLFPSLFFSRNSQEEQANNSKKKEGEVTIDYIEKKKGKNDNENGEYIEFEELE